jgi:hypothetical protein
MNGCGTFFVIVTGAGADISAFLDLGKAKRIKQQIRRVNAVLSEWMIESLERDAAKIGVSSQSVIKVWLAEHLQQRGASAIF